MVATDGNRDGGEGMGVIIIEYNGEGAEPIETDLCPGPFPGYSECEFKIEWNLENRPNSWFTKNDLERTRCSMQEMWYENGRMCPSISGPTEPTETDLCPGPFPGYSECEFKIEWNLENRPNSWFTKNDLERTRCSMQEMWYENGRMCPLPVPAGIPTGASTRAPSRAPAAADCPGPFPGYPTCNRSIEWGLVYRPASWFIKYGLDRTRCSVQSFFYENMALCPAPIVDTSPTTEPTYKATTAATMGNWQQCGGQEWRGPTTCGPGFECQVENQWYSQCRSV